MDNNQNEVGLKAVFEIARKMGVEIFYVSSIETFDDFEYWKFWNSPSGYFGAAHRVVWCCEEDPCWMELLHEVSHAVWCGPGRNPSDNNETIGQDQWERSVVKAMVRAGFLDKKLESYHFEYQSDSIRMEESRSIVEHEDFDSWKYGEYVSVITGACSLDSEGNIVPTWNLPNFVLVSKNVEEDLLHEKWSFK